MSLRLENGETKTYRNDPKACANDDATNCVYYGLGGYHPAAHIYLILIQYYEGSGSELVSARTGKTLSFSGVPHFSPDGSNFIVIDNDLAYGGSFDIAVGSTVTDPPSLVWQQSAKNGPVQWHLKRWIDNDRIALRVLSADGKCHEQDCDAFLVCFNNSWTIKSPPAKPD